MPACVLSILAIIAISGCGGSNTANNAQNAAPSPAAETATTTAAAPADTSPEAMAALGAKIYEQRCALCHGPGGKGDGPAAAGMNPKPRDHTDAKYMNSRTDAQLLDVIHNGKGGMPAWKGVLSEQEMKAVLIHVRTLAKP